MKNFSLFFILIFLLLSGVSCDSIFVETPPEYELTVDPTDYLEDINPMQQLFESNTTMYYAEYGLPAIANASFLEEDLGEDYYAPFETILQYFDVQMAQNAINNQQWQAEFINKMQEYNTQPIEEQWVETILFFAKELNQLLQNNSTEPRVGQLYMYLGDGLNYAVQPNFFQEVNFEGDPERTTPQELPNEIGICEMEIFPSVSCDGKVAGGADDNATEKKDWEKVEDPYKTSKDGMCATLATGLCLNKLNKVKDKADGKTWNKISCEIKARPTGGAFNHNINDYYRRLGYGVTTAYDGLGLGSKTAVEQAKAALDRGCDVKIVYHDGSWIGGQQHIEFVRTIDLDKNKRTRATIKTISWGTKASVIYDDDKFRRVFRKVCQC